ncbi:MAG: winged helix-turn-helix transcriptional regulator [Zestosphaera sp.]
MKLITPEFLEALYGIRTVGKFQIAKELAELLREDLRSVLIRINTLLKARYFYFTVDYSLSNLGLKLAVIITDKDLLTESSAKFMKFLRAVVYAFPDKRFYSLYIPVDMEDLSASLKSLENSVVMEFHERLRNKTSFTTYGIESAFSPESGFSAESLQKLKRFVEVVITESQGKETESKNKVPFDALDLGIIKELEKDAFIKQVDIAKALGISVGKLRRHARNHVPYLIKGIRLMSLPIYPAALGTSLLVSVKSRDAAVIKGLCEALTTHPTVVSCGYRIDRGLGLAQFVTPFSMIKYIVEFLESAGREYGFEVLRDKMWLLNVEFGKRFTLPYKRWVEYVPKMSWNVDELRRIFSGFKGEVN